MTDPGLFRGQATFYDIAADGATSCGGTYTNNDMVCALGFLTMDMTEGTSPNPQCGRQIQVFSAANPAGIVVTIVDTARGSTGPYDLDLTVRASVRPAVSGRFRPGHVAVTWKYLT